MFPMLVSLLLGGGSAHAAQDFISIDVTAGVPAKVAVAADFVAEDSSGDDTHYQHFVKCTTVGLSTTPGTGSVSCPVIGSVPAQVVAGGGGARTLIINLDIVRSRFATHHSGWVVTSWTHAGSCTPGDTKTAELRFEPGTECEFKCMPWGAGPGCTPWARWGRPGDPRSSRA